MNCSPIPTHRFGGLRQRARSLHLLSGYAKSLQHLPASTPNHSIEPTFAGVASVFINPPCRQMRLMSDVRPQRRYRAVNRVTSNRPTGTAGPSVCAAGEPLCPLRHFVAGARAGCPSHARPAHGSLPSEGAMLVHLQRLCHLRSASEGERRRTGKWSAAQPTLRVGATT